MATDVASARADRIYRTGPESLAAEAAAVVTGPVANHARKDVVMSQTASKQAYPRGTYLGANRIEGNVDLTGSKIGGDLTVNGTALPRTT